MIRVALFYFGLRVFLVFCFPSSEKHLFLFHQEDKLLTNLLNQWALFSIFANFCNVGFIEDTWIFISTSAISLLQYIVLVEVYEENLANIDRLLEMGVFQ